MEFKQFTLVVVYVPNSMDNGRRLDYRINEWDVDLREYLNSLRSTLGKPVILAGDLNVVHEEHDIYDLKSNEINPGCSLKERQSYELLLEDCAFIDTYRLLYPKRVQYTFWSLRKADRPINRGWRIDYFLINDDYESKYGIELVDSIIADHQVGSDHCPIGLILRIPLEGEADNRAN